MIREPDPLEEARRVHEVASSRGFDWPDVSGVIAKVKEEVREIEEALAHGDTRGAQRELGDLLFTAVNLARFLGADASQSLRETTARFDDRFQRLLAALSAQGRQMEQCTLDELDVAWEQVKKSLSNDAKTS